MIYEFYDPTPKLRFVKRGDKRILQQYMKERFGKEIYDHWADVPTVVEDNPEFKDAK